MSYSGQSGSNTPTPQPHASLPARPTGPLPSLNKAFSGGGYGGDNAQGQSYGQQGNTTSTFRPRAVAAVAASAPTTSRNWQQNYSSTVSAPAVSSPGATTTFSSSATYQAQPDYNAQQQYSNYYSSSGYSNPSPAPAPQIKNPFAPPPQSGASGYSGPTHDPEYEQQMQQWQAAYMGKDDGAKKNEGNANLTPIGIRPNIGPTLSSSEIAAAAPTGSKAAAVVQGADGKQATVVRAGGGKTWTDESLLEWDPAHPRLFIGNLAGEVTDDSLYKAFSKYTSIVKTKVVRDRRTTKSKGYGFVSFRDADDYLKAFKEMQGKYIGSHPVLIKKSNTEIKAVDPKKNQHGNKGKNGKFAGKNRDVTNAHTGAGVKKGQNKTRDGMVLLG